MAGEKMGSWPGLGNGGAGRGQVGQRGHQDRRGRPFLPGVAQCHAQGEGKPAAGGVTGHRQ
jgi:hypothetical protein